MYNALKGRDYGEQIEIERKGGRGGEGRGVGREGVSE